MVWTFDLIEDMQRVPETYLKHVKNTDGLYEIRVQKGKDIYRVFCFFDQKKTTANLGQKSETNSNQVIKPSK
ncbi:MAG: type II toxin-antitoxin system RelE/ParE family toxin [Bacteroidales bacterium]|nr:type II toxin-antitoxin system RelE/ParE family toxin [Bacteroidales bacterium]